MALLAAISLFAAAFVILNTLAMTVSERVRELGLLRAAGARRAQIVEVVVAQALIVGTLGSVIGLVLGVVLAEIAAAWLRGSGGAPIDGPAITAPVLVGGLIAGIAITLVAAMEPARRAASISPVAALRARSDAARTVRSHASWVIAIVVLVGALAAVLLPPTTGSGAFPIRAVAVYVVLLFAVLVTPAVLGPLGRIAGLPFAGPLRLEERLARAAIARDRSRTTVTIGALVIGLAMVVALGAVATNARASASAWLSEVVPGDEVLTAIAPSPVGEDGLEHEIAAIDGVTRATPIAAFDLAFAGTRLDAVAIRGADFGADGRLIFTAGDRDAALAAVDAGGAVILPRSRAEQLRVGLGDVIVVATASGPAELTVAGIVDRSFPGKSGEAALVGWTDATSKLGVLGADAYVIRFDPARAAAASAAVADLATELALTAAPVSRVEGAQGEALDGVFGLLDLLALAAVVVAGLGIVNTLSMGTWERIRELGVLRAAGMSRRQVWRSVLVEAGILGTIGGHRGLGGRPRRRGAPGGLRREPRLGAPGPVGVDRPRARPRRHARDARGRTARPHRRPALDRVRGPERLSRRRPWPGPAARWWWPAVPVARLGLDATPYGSRHEGDRCPTRCRPSRGCPPRRRASRSRTSSSRCGSASASRPGCATWPWSSPASLLIYLTAQVVFLIPGNPVPITLQNFGVLVVGGSLGLRRGGLAAFLYVALGVVGLPFFAEHKGGISVILGSTGGYLVGFVLAGALVGRLAELGWDRRIVGAIGATALGTLMIYAVGVPWLAVTTGLSLSRAIELGLLPFVVVDTIKLLAAAAVFPFAWWVVGRRPSDR